ncbi:Hypothetical protein PBC10988_10230 [Planctomycetales bacterium 10988]|nr:Hypothetical protein PBC10988_10230 [Planctomycetales bacterium 10988]
MSKSRGRCPQCDLRFAADGPAKCPRCHSNSTKSTLITKKSKKRASTLSLCTEGLSGLSSANFSRVSFDPVNLQEFLLVGFLFALGLLIALLGGWVLGLAPLVGMGMLLLSVCLQILFGLWMLRHMIHIDLLRGFCCLLVPGYPLYFACSQVGTHAREPFLGYFCGQLLTITGCLALFFPASPFSPQPSNFHRYERDLALSEVKSAGSGTSWIQLPDAPALTTQQERLFQDHQERKPKEVTVRPVSVLGPQEKLSENEQSATGITSANRDLKLTPQLAQVKNKEEKTPEWDSLVGAKSSPDQKKANPKPLPEDSAQSRRANTLKDSVVSTEETRGSEPNIPQVQAKKSDNHPDAAIAAPVSGTSSYVQRSRQALRKGDVQQARQYQFASILTEESDWENSFEWCPALRRATVGLHWCFGVHLDTSVESNYAEFFESLSEGKATNRPQLQQHRAEHLEKMFGGLAEQLLLPLEKRFQEGDFGLVADQKTSEEAIDWKTASVTLLGVSNRSDLVEQAKSADADVLLMASFSERQVGPSTDLLVTFRLIDVQTNLNLWRFDPLSQRQLGFASSVLKPKAKKNVRSGKAKKAPRRGPSPQQIAASLFHRLREEFQDYLDIHFYLRHDLPLNSQTVASRAVQLVSASSQPSPSQKIATLAELNFYHRQGWLNHDAYRSAINQVLTSEEAAKFFSDDSQSKRELFDSLLKTL